MGVRTGVKPRPRKKTKQARVGARRVLDVGWSKDAVARRIGAIQGAMRRVEAPWLLLTSPQDVAYASGFLGGDSYLLVPAGGRTKPVIISDSRFDEELALQRGQFDVVMRTDAISLAVGAWCAEQKVKALAIQAEHTTLAGRDALLRACKGVRLVETTGIVSGLRIIKDAQEVALIREAIVIQECALAETLSAIRSGQTELEVAAMLEGEMKRRGSSAPAFETIVGARANGSLPHYRPGTATTAKGTALLIDWGATYRGYRGDMTRTFALGKWPAKLAEVYDVVLAAHESAAAALREGATTHEVDAVARGLIARAGYGDNFGHGLGHGLGLNVHEGPSLSQRGKAEALRAGMVVTIEPGIYLPGVGGVRIEDDYLVTKKGSENLCSLPKDRAWSTL